MDENKIYLLETDDNKNNLLKPVVYKIGRTNRKNLIRLREYPKTYKIILVRACINSKNVENEILKIFNQKYIKEKRNEYFSGNINEMINDINQIINNEFNNVPAHVHVPAPVLVRASVPAHVPAHVPASNPDHGKTLIIIKFKISEIGKEYYITNQNHKILHKINNRNHIEWILSNDYAENNNGIEITENNLYDINNILIINYILLYSDDLGSCMNVEIKKWNGTNNNLNNYFKLSVKSKIEYLFEADTFVSNLNGRYLIRQNILYSFECDVDADDPDENEIFIHYYIKMGTIIDSENLLEFNLINRDFAIII